MNTGNDYGDMIELKNDNVLKTVFEATILLSFLLMAPYLFSENSFRVFESFMGLYSGIYMLGFLKLRVSETGSYFLIEVVKMF